MTIRNIKKRSQDIRRSNDKILSDLIEIQDSIKKLPPLDFLEKVKLENSIAIDQLYYSSHLEGSRLTEKALEDAIHDKTF